MSLRDFDVVAPFPLLHRISKAIGIQRMNDDGTPHNGSSSWADFLGLWGYHDNNVKQTRRVVVSVLTLGAAQLWIQARGLGSKPDPASPN